MSDLITETNQFVSDLEKWHGSTVGKTVVGALLKNKFDASYYETRHEAARAVMHFIKPGHRVALGGSQTTKQLGLPDLIKDAGAVLLDHNAPGLEMEERLEIMRQQQVCDVFICSSNAVTLDGGLYNVDGYGNRLSAMTFGPKKVVVIAGTNKICKNEETAWERIRAVAAPVNMKRLNRQNPCTVTGYCGDCNSQTRGCNAFLALKKKPTYTDISVFIVNENLGF